jgi:hypothetical protein
VLIHACISGHGYGHGSRTAAILLALAARRPDWRLVVSTSLPPAFLAGAFGPVAVEFRPGGWDVGVVQADALGADGPATLAALAELERQLPERIEREAAWLAGQPGPKLLLGDVPPAAARLARRTGLPLLLIGNFGWDAIYAPMGGAFVDWAERCRRLYATADGLIRCPFALPMEWGLPSITVGLTVAPPRLDTEQLRRDLALPAERHRCVLVSFGGMGLELGPEPFRRWPDHLFVTSDTTAAAASNVRLLPAGVRPIELMPLVERLITKPGYSSFCEALAMGVGIHLVHREGFAEAPVLEQGLCQHGHHRLLGQAEARAGAWQLDEPLLPPEREPLAVDGAQRAAAWIEQEALQRSGFGESVGDAGVGDYEKQDDQQC